VLDLWAAAGSLPTITDSRDGLARLLATDSQALLVAEIEGVLAGSLIAAWDGWRGSFYRLAVSPEHRRKGLATRSGLLRWTTSPNSQGILHLQARQPSRLYAP
jgi:ribosomal protein S18 acetylase RimI-like enzyme